MRFYTVVVRFYLSWMCCRGQLSLKRCAIRLVSTRFPICHIFRASYSDRWVHSLSKMMTTATSVNSAPCHTVHYFAIARHEDRFMQWLVDIDKSLWNLFNVQPINSNNKSIKLCPIKMSNAYTQPDHSITNSTWTDDALVGWLYTISVSIYMYTRTPGISCRSWIQLSSFLRALE